MKSAGTLPGRHPGLSMPFLRRNCDNVAKAVFARAFYAKIKAMEEGYMYHDSRRPHYRSPFGAVKAGESLRIVADLQGQNQITLRLWIDGQEKLVHGLKAGGMVEFTFVAEHTGLIWYYFILDGPGGRRYYGVQRGFGGVGRLYDNPPPSWQVTVYDPTFETPAWFREGVVYQIFPDRFFRAGEMLGIEEHRSLGHRILVHESWDEKPLYLPPAGEADYDPCDFYGGNLAGIREKLPYLASLGVTCLYLNPVFLSPSNHRYNTADYLRVDPILGTEADLQALIQAAAGYGMGVMLDGVFSHTGDDSVYFDAKGTYGNGAYSDPHSPYRTWYDFTRYPNEYRCWWGFCSLPEVNENEPAYMAFIEKVLAHYGAMGVAGWRLDVADELPDPFIAFLREKVKALNPKSVLLGEVWDDASNKEGFGARRQYVDGHELDSAMGYPFKDAALSFLLGERTAPELCEGLMTLMENYPRPFYDAQLNILGSHDTIRALTVLAGAPHRDALSREGQAKWQPNPGAIQPAHALLKLGVLLQFGLPGVPCIYYGDEAGLTGMADPFNRKPYPWGREDADLLAFYRSVSAARRSCAALCRGGCGMAALSPDVFAAIRCEGESGAVLVINRAAKPFTGVLDLARFQQGPDVNRLWLSGRYRDVISGEEVPAENGTLPLRLPPMGGLLLTKIE